MFSNSLRQPQWRCHLTPKGLSTYRLRTTALRSDSHFILEFDFLDPHKNEVTKNWCFCAWLTSLSINVFQVHPCCKWQFPSQRIDIPCCTCDMLSLCCIDRQVRLFCVWAGSTESPSECQLKPTTLPDHSSTTLKVCLPKRATVSVMAIIIHTLKDNVWEFLLRSRGFHQVIFSLLFYFIVFYFNGVIYNPAWPQT